MDTKRLFPILLIIFTNILGAGVILPVLPLFAEGQFQGTIPQITFLSTAFFAAQFLAAPVLGPPVGSLRPAAGAADQPGGHSTGFCAVYLCRCVGPVDRWLGSWPADDRGDGHALRRPHLDGITGGNITTAQAYVSDVTTDRQRAQGLGLVAGGVRRGLYLWPGLWRLVEQLWPGGAFRRRGGHHHGHVAADLFHPGGIPAAQKKRATDQKRPGIGEPCGGCLPPILRWRICCGLAFSLRWRSRLCLRSLPSLPIACSLPTPPTRTASSSISASC